MPAPTPAELAPEDGRVEVRYKPNDGRRYQARADNLEVVDATPLPDETCGEASAVVKPDAAAKGSAKAKAAAGAPTQAATPGAVNAYADGACSGNPGPAGLGVVVIDGPRRVELSEYLGQGTNNIAELTAVLRAVAEIPRDRPMMIYTDSQYTIGVVQKGWKGEGQPGSGRRAARRAVGAPRHPPRLRPGTLGRPAQRARRRAGARGRDRPQDPARGLRAQAGSPDAVTRRRRAAWALGVAAVLAVAGGIAVEHVGASALVYAPNAGHPPESRRRPPAARDRGADPGARPPRPRSAPPRASLSLLLVDPPAPRGTVFVLHGIRDRKDSMLGWGRGLAQAGYRAVLVDARGHGRSSGDFLTYGVVESRDLSQVLDALEAQGLAAGRVGVMGVSYGASTAIEWAGAEPRVAAGWWRSRRSPRCAR